MRTTLDIDDPILESLKELKRREGKSLGQLASELLARALQEKKRQESEQPRPVSWTARPMGARVDLGDRDALYDALDGRES